MYTPANQMDKSKQITKGFEEIAASKLFQAPSIYLELLDYLCKSTLRGESPKELTIATDVFNKKIEQGKEVNVRPYIYNLRKKLDQFYQDEGRDTLFRLEISKGKYTIEVTTNKKSRSWKRYGIAAVLFLLTVAFLLKLNYDSQYRFQNSKIWEGFLTNKKPTLFILGDHYFFNSHNEGLGWIVSRKPAINSDGDLLNALSGDQIENYRKGGTQYLNPQTAHGLFHFMPILAQAKSDCELRMSSEFQWDMVYDHNVIFLGSYKTVGKLNDIIRDLGINIHLQEGIDFRTNGKDSTFHFGEQGIRTDLISMLKFTTPKQNDVLIILSMADFGNIGLAKRLADPSSLRKLEKELEGHDNFRALLGVEGMGNTDSNMKLITIESIEEVRLNLWP